MGSNSRWHICHVLYVSDAAVCAGRVTELAAAKKISKYAEMCRNYIFVPLACEVSGAWCTGGLEFLNDLGSRISNVTGDKRCFRDCP